MSDSKKRQTVADETEVIDTTIRNVMFADRYRVIELLGSGGMGSVYLAHDTALENMPVALKILHKDLSADEKQTARFLREVTLTRQVTHPNVLRTYEFGKAKDQLYFTMEYAKGKTLYDLAKEEPLPPGIAMKVLREICAGLVAIHEAGVVHRDLKPGNVIITVEGVLKIADFGVARPVRSNLTAHSEVVGSAHYMAPEVWLGKQVTARTDLYSLGVMFYELLTGVLPFDGDSAAEIMCKHLERAPIPPQDLDNKIPPWVGAVVMWLLEKEAGARPESATALLAHLDEQSRAAASASDTSSVQPPPVPSSEVAAAAAGPFPLGGPDTGADLLRSTIDSEQPAGLDNLSDGASDIAQHDEPRDEPRRFAGILWNLASSPVMRIACALLVVGLVLPTLIPFLPEPDKSLGRSITWKMSPWFVFATEIAGTYFLAALLWCIPAAPLLPLKRLILLPFLMTAVFIICTGLLFGARALTWMVVENGSDPVPGALEAFDLLRQSFWDVLHGALLMPRDIGLIEAKSLVLLKTPRTVSTSLAFGGFLLAAIVSLFIGVRAAAHQYRSAIGELPSALVRATWIVIVSTIASDAILVFSKTAQAARPLALLPLSLLEVPINSIPASFLLIHWTILSGAALVVGLRYRDDPS